LDQGEDKMIFLVQSDLFLELCVLMARRVRGKREKVREGVQRGSRRRRSRTVFVDDGGSRHGALRAAARIFCGGTILWLLYSDLSPPLSHQSPRVERKATSLVKAS
jgi:hypothetical protein